MAGSVSGEPMVLQGTVRRLASFTGGHSEATLLLIAAIEFGVGLGALIPRTLRVSIVVAIGFAVATWVLFQGMGGLSSGTSTDPNSAPALILLAAIVWVVASKVSATTLEGGTR